MAKTFPEMAHLPWVIDTWGKKLIKRDVPNKRICAFKAEINTVFLLTAKDEKFDIIGGRRKGIWHFTLIRSKFSLDL